MTSLCYQGLMAVTKPVSHVAQPDHLGPLKIQSRRLLCQSVALSEAIAVKKKLILTFNIHQKTVHAVAV